MSISDPNVGLASEWSDYEIVNSRFSAFTGGSQPGFQSGGTEPFLAITDNMVPDASLERDEYAELVGFHREAVFYTEDNQDQEQGQRGHAVADWNLLVNEEPETEVIQGGQEPGGSRLENREYGGLIDVGILHCNPMSGSTDAVPAQAQSGGQSTNSFREIYFREMLGSGPVVDRFDDIKFLAGLQKSNILPSATLELEYQFFFDVVQVEQDDDPFGRM
jgi:hypothetical protein